MIHRIEVGAKPGRRDTRGEKLARQIAQAGLGGVTSVAVSDLYFIEGGIEKAGLDRLVSTLLVDDILEQAQTGVSASSGARIIEVTLLPGVTDSAAESLRTGADVIGIQNLGQIAVGQRYDLRGTLTAADAKAIAERLIINTVVQTYAVDAPIAAPFVAVSAASGPLVETIALREASDEKLLAVSKSRRLALDLVEMRAIQLYYRKEGRDPTDAEIEMLAQTWSEHCVTRRSAPGSAIPRTAGRRASSMAC